MAWKDDSINGLEQDMQERDLKIQVMDALRSVVNTEVNVSVLDLGLIHHLEVDEKGQVRLAFQPTSPVCPLAFKIAQDIQEVLRGMEGIHSVEMQMADYVSVFAVLNE